MINIPQFLEALDAKLVLESDGYYALIDYVEGEYILTVYGKPWPAKNCLGVKVINKKTLIPKVVKET